MKKLIVLLSIALLSQNFCLAQEFFTSISVARRLALIQDKMLFVVWEESLNSPYPLLYNDDKGNLIIIDLSQDKSLDAVIWEHFVPVLLSETEYDRLIKASEGRKASYIAKLNDDSIKIMDVNEHILNTKITPSIGQNLSELINTYALRTTFLKQDLINYSQQENFTTSFNLGSKYIDFAIFVEKTTRSEIINLASIYLEKAQKHLETSNLDDKEAYSQRVDLMYIKEDLVLHKARRASRLLKRMDKTTIADINEPLFSFLNYTTLMLLKDQEKAALWQSDLSEVDLKKAQLIFNINN
jgi:hypothetical protein